MEDLKRLYDADTSFKCYVDKYANAYSFSLSEALQHALVMEVAKSYQEEKSDGRIDGWRSEQSTAEEG